MKTKAPEMDEALQSRMTHAKSIDQMIWVGKKTP